MYSEYVFRMPWTSCSYFLPCHYMAGALAILLSMEITGERTGAHMAIHSILSLLNCVLYLAQACICVEGEVPFLCYKDIHHSPSHAPKELLLPKRCLVIICTKESYGLIGSPDVLCLRMSKRVNTSGI